MHVLGSLGMQGWGFWGRNQTLAPRGQISPSAVGITSPSPSYGPMAPIPNRRRRRKSGMRHRPKRLARGAAVSTMSMQTLQLKSRRPIVPCHDDRIAVAGLPPIGATHLRKASNGTNGSVNQFSGSSDAPITLVAVSHGPWQSVMVGATRVGEPGTASTTTVGSVT